MAKSLIDKIIYRITRKPECYKEVKAPPRTDVEKLLRPQDARQLQYNRWSRFYRVYSGSYLPKDRNKLEKKGWENATPSSINFDNPTTPVFYKRKSTKQWVRYDRDKQHWHWYNWWKEAFPFKNDKKQLKIYLDKYGEVCIKGKTESHIDGRD